MTTATSLLGHVTLGTLNGRDELLPKDALEEFGLEVYQPVLVNKMLLMHQKSKNAEKVRKLVISQNPIFQN